MPRTKLPDRKVTLLRVPPELYREVEAVAAEEARSVNAQITVALRSWLEARKAKRRGVAHGE
jgi:hypothetical protein